MNPVLRFLPVFMSIVPWGILLRHFGPNAHTGGLIFQMVGLVLLLVFRKQIFK